MILLSIMYYHIKFFITKNFYHIKIVSVTFTNLSRAKANSKAKDSSLTLQQEQATKANNKSRQQKQTTRIGDRSRRCE